MKNIIIFTLTLSMASVASTSTVPTETSEFSGSFAYHAGCVANGADQFVMQSAAWGLTAASWTVRCLVASYPLHFYNLFDAVERGLVRTGYFWSEAYLKHYNPSTWLLGKVLPDMRVSERIRNIAQRLDGDNSIEGKSPLWNERFNQGYETAQGVSEIGNGALALLGIAVTARARAAAPQQATEGTVAVLPAAEPAGLFKATDFSSTAMVRPAPPAQVSVFDERRPSFIQHTLLPSFTFDTMLSNTAGFRRKMAELDKGRLGHKENWQDFGTALANNGDRIKTPLTKYPVTTKLLQMTLEGLAQQQALKQISEFEKIPTTSGQDFYAFRLILDKEFQRGFSVGMSKANFEAFIQKRQAPTFDTRATDILHGIGHQRALAKAKIYFNIAVQTGIQADLAKNLAGLFYHLAICTPFKRGSAAIAEIMMEAVAYHLGYDLVYPTQEQVRTYFRDDSLHVSGRQVVDQLAQGSFTFDDFHKHFVALIKLTHSRP